MDKQRVLLVAPCSEKIAGGVNTWTKNVLGYHQSHDCRFNVVLLNTAFRFKPNLIKNDLLRFLYGMFDSLLVLVMLVVNVIKYKPSTIHYVSGGSNALWKDWAASTLVSLFNVPFVVHWHFGLIPELSQKKNMEWKLLNRINSKAKAAIVLDHASMNSLLENGTNNVVLVSNPVSMDVSNIAKTIDFDYKPLEVGTFVYVGQVIPTKGVFELVEACSTIGSLRRLILVGPYSPEIKAKLNAIASKRDKGEWLVWKGKVPFDEVLPCLYSANALCLPSYTEGFPNVILEAMSVGCAVVATNVGAIEEMIDSDKFGKAGICIEPKNEQQLTEALRFLMEHPETALEYGKNGRSRVMSAYTLEHIYPQYEQCWS